MCVRACRHLILEGMVTVQRLKKDSSSDWKITWMDFDRLLEFDFLCRQGVFWTAIYELCNWSDWVLNGRVLWTLAFSPSEHT